MADGDQKAPSKETSHAPAGPRPEQVGQGQVPAQDLPAPPLGMPTPASPGLASVSAARAVTQMTGLPPDAALNFVEGSLEFGSDFDDWLSDLDDRLDAMMRYL